MFFPIMTAVGLALFLITLVMLDIKAFKRNMWWGLGFSTIPFVGLIFVYLHWGVCKKTAYAHFAGIAMTVIGYGMAEGF